MKTPKQKSVTADIHHLTPSQIVGELDKYIIGQHDAKRAVAIALRNRWRRLHAPESMRDEIIPNNIILIGPTGVGKTEIARRLARLANAPFLKVEASKFTEVGYVGRDVESMVRDLTEIAVTMVKSEKALEVQEQAAKLAEERLLDLLLPYRKPGTSHQEKDEAGSDQETYQSTREKFREKLRAGQLDNRMVELEVSSSQMPSMQVLGPFSVDDLGINLQEMMGNLFPKKTKQRKVSVREALAILTAEEAQKLIDMEAAVKEALQRVQNTGIVFVDEIDKIARKGHEGAGPDVSREGVQRDLLPIVEGSSVMTKYGMVKTDHILFIAAGAFHIAKPSDLIPELQGRFPIRVELKSLSEEDFVKILTLPQNALIKQYETLLKSEGIDLSFDDGAIREIATIATEVNSQVENIGARRLHTIMTTLLEDILYEAPDKVNKDSIHITRELVQQKLQSIVKNRDLSKYIL